ncbi:MAG: hypothetical protein ACREPY_10830 [Rhodanobacteraceae bacterium]
MDLRNRRRLQAGLIAAIFAVPVIIALALTSLGWIPNGRSYGKPIRPERNLASVPVQLVTGQSFSWSNQNAVWTLVALPGPDCAEHCLRQLDLAHRAQITLGRHADKLRLLYLGPPPAGAAAAGFDQVWTLATTPSHALDDLRAAADDSVSAVLVTPDGKALTRYTANFSVEGLRKDLKKVVH